MRLPFFDLFLTQKGAVVSALIEKNKVIEAKVKPNCWEYRKCGRQPGGHKVHELGVCPAPAEQLLNGIHGGKNAGRACWVVAGSLCNGKVQGIHAKKLLNCWQCEFMISVQQEEESTSVGFLQTRILMERAIAKRKAGTASSPVPSKDPEHSRP